jgi:hypothetical protein
MILRNTVFTTLFGRGLYYLIFYLRLPFKVLQSCTLSFQLSFSQECRLPLHRAHVSLLVISGVLLPTMRESPQERELEGE